MEIPVNCRQVGRTSRQILDAPIGSVMVCATYSQATYNTRLAKSLGRRDIICEPLQSIMARAGGLLKGRTGLNVIVDHAVPEILPGRGLYADLIYMLTMEEQNGRITRHAKAEDAKWKAKISSPRVNHNGTGFWAVHQNEANL